MRVFLAGNFPQMSRVENERGMREYVFEKGEEYNRLGSFFYVKGLMNVIEVKEEVRKK